MSLIKCPECNNDVSSAAEKCPNCGYSLNKQNTVVEIKPTVVTVKRKRTGCMVSVLLGIAAFIAFSVIIALTSPTSNNSRGADARGNVATSPGLSSAPGAKELDTEPTAEPAPAIDWRPAGMYKVGTDIPAGEYYVENTGLMTYFAITKDSSGNFGSIIANGTTNTFCYVTVNEGEYLQIQFGRFVEASNAPQITLNETAGEGMYKIGRDLPAGEYVVYADSNAPMSYIAVTKDSRHTLGSIITNDGFTGSKYVTVKDGQYLTVNWGYIQIEKP